jgi:hypothetical protein
MTEAAFTSQYGEIYRALPYLIGSKPEIVTRLHQLHARHGKAVIQVVNDRLARGANVTAILSRAHTSLLAVLQTSVNAATIKDAVEEEPTASEQAATIKFVPIDRPIGFAIDEPRQRVYFKGGVQLKGALFELFNVLRRVFDEDQAANLSREQCRTLTAGSLADRLARDESTVRKYVAMLRRSLQKQFRDRLKAVVDEDDIIENSGRRVTDSILISSANTHGSLGLPSATTSQCRNTTAELPQFGRRRLDIARFFYLACRIFFRACPYQHARAAAKITAFQSHRWRPARANADHAVTI